MRNALALALLLVVAAPLSGCFKRDAAPGAGDEPAGAQPFTEQELERLDAVASPKPMRFSFPSESPVGVRSRTAWMNGTVGPEANAAFEAAQDRGGTSFNTLLQTQDFSAFAPPGQGTLINVRLWFDNGPARSVDLDVFVETHGARTHEAREYADEMTWTLPVKTKSVATSGLGPTTIGVQAANGRMAPGQQVSYWMRIEFLYATDVVAPKVPYALQVPANASGLIVESVKFAGDTHVQGRFLIVSPSNELVTAVDFDDISIPTQSIYVPVPGPGEYVFYVVDVKNGFFTVRADAPLDEPVARRLATRVTETVLLTDALAPGVAAHDVYGTRTEYVEGASAGFSVDGAFPLEVWPFLRGDGFTGDVHLRVENAKGVVSEYHRFLRYDGAQGTLGVSDEDLDGNQRIFPQNLARGPHRLSAVVDGMQGEAGVRIVQYER